MKNKILIIDIETTGFLKAGGYIVEVGMVELDLNTGKRMILFDEVCHEKGISHYDVASSWIVKNSSLTIKMVQTSKNLERLRKKIQGIIDLYTDGCTAYNNVFDFGFMEDRGFTFPVKLDCPMKLSTSICKIKKKKGSGYKWPSVEEAYKYFIGDGYVELHRGADDAMHEAEIIYELYLRGIFKPKFDHSLTDMENMKEEYSFEKREDHDEIIEFLKSLDIEDGLKPQPHWSISNVSEWKNTQIALLQYSNSQTQYNACLNKVDAVRLFCSKK